MNLGTALSIGKNGLAAASHGTNVTGQNISNAATPGYTRRLTELEPIPLQHGGGVRANGSTRVQDAYLERRGLNARAQNGEANARVETLQVLDSVFTDEQGSVGAALAAFDTALADFSADPSLRANRQAVLIKADELSRAFGQTSGALTQARSDANTRIVGTVQQVNAKLTDIGSLGAQIVQARINGNESGDLEDRRDMLVREVSEQMPVTVLPEDNGAITMILGGSRTLVAVDGTVNKLIAQTDTTSGDVRIYRTTAGQLEDITGLMTTGAIGGTISARDGALATARTQLDQLASDVAVAYNAQHSTGFGLDGATGRNLFGTPATVAGAAYSFAVSTDVAGQPDFLAGATDAANLPSDNRNAIALLGVRDLAIAMGGSARAQQAFSAMVADGGTAARAATTQADQTGAVLGQIDALREATSGVSTDEEMISLMKFQRAYSASLRVIETADSMLQELLNMRR